ncbi:amino acid permease [Aspergillus heteromorphus CBS 117.55]|uniref:Amino acid permease n=1 Tax=Aspergillus heteromorphus CBS 117.55 TaxID=1448321 RepID=A0A317X2M7_9EURO|nr:amino acid permease [Aspergillus heteromorphus CBS 117.55]PWY90800.1 amino acid permease [Aspergillus heteromorphus CBS 117.55]
MTDHAARLCDPALGFTLGWIYWIKFMLIIPNQLAAGELLIAYWQDDEAKYSVFWITTFLGAIITANSLCSRYLGKLDVVLSFFKVLVMSGLMGLCVVLAFGGGPDRDIKGFRYWRDPGAFANGSGSAVAGTLRAICRTVPSATLAYVGSELMGMTILRTQNPRKAAGRAIKVTFYRILVFNLVNLTLLGMLVPYDTHILAFNRQVSQQADKHRTASAFVAVAQSAGPAFIPHLLNACLVLFVLSAANHALLMASRTLYGISLDRNAPSFLSRTNRRGVPINAVGVCSALACLAYLNISSGSKKLFEHSVNLVSMFSILTWVSIIIIHFSFIRARRAQKITDELLTFKAPLGLFGSWLALIACVLVVVIRGFDLVDRASYPNGVDRTAFVTSYIGIPLYITLVIGYKIGTKSKHVQPQDVDMGSLTPTVEPNGADAISMGPEERNPIPEKPAWSGQRLFAWFL